MSKATGSNKLPSGTVKNVKGQSALSGKGGKKK